MTLWAQWEPVVTAEGGSSDVTTTVVTTTPVTTTPVTTAPATTEPVTTVITPTGTLPATGTDETLPLVVVALVMVMVGTLARRSTRDH